jgi:hypothetical protein
MFRDCDLPICLNLFQLNHFKLPAGPATVRQTGARKTAAPTASLVLNEIGVLFEKIQDCANVIKSVVQVK